MTMKNWVTQHRDQFGLAGGAFQEAATEDADAHGSAERAPDPS